ncbi:TIGR01244 family sulfur transferase [Profundibacter sp.]|uniref:TIGR01244 family sulfur transferase n=1 Tax=Profundibacter sp. TaxID=3101071 RepID=UPI003D119F92
MEIRRLSDDFAVSPQIKVEDLQAIWDAGYRTLICNRPDGEEAEQADFAAIEAEARKIGFEVFHIPAISGRAAMPHAIQTRKALETAPKPVFAYCRTGTRCTVIWSLMMLGEMEDADILASAAAAGYDMSRLIHVD